jgi:hypothetical protein
MLRKRLVSRARYYDPEELTKDWCGTDTPGVTVATVGPEVKKYQLS